ncbi:hypothetical protein AUJ17_04740 [Candidatus Micrarchaeota archaeon CG1_02_47_40]|nr:MAG: hypothetical protein AUJ17_04740 [Candidatus Micrarchaeota archaeon CG1_02_47_40]
MTRDLKVPKNFQNFETLCVSNVLPEGQADLGIIIFLLDLMTRDLKVPKNFQNFETLCVSNVLPEGQADLGNY